MSEEIDFEPPVEPGHSFEKKLRLTAQEISTFAELSGDFNPLHHDAQVAGASRYGGIIASGPHSSSLYMATFASHLAPGYMVMGVEFDVKFIAPLRPDTDFKIYWTVTSVVPKPKLMGYIVHAEGGIADGESNILLGKATALIIKD